MKKTNKKDKNEREIYALARNFLYVYHRGIMDGINRCDKATSLNAIKIHVNSRADSFVKLAQKCISRIK
jgi:hypothetical protein